MTCIVVISECAKCSYFPNSTHNSAFNSLKSKAINYIENVDPASLSLTNRTVFHAFSEAVTEHEDPNCLNDSRKLHFCATPADTCIRQLIYSKYDEDTEPAIIYSCGQWNISVDEVRCVTSQDKDNWWEMCGCKNSKCNSMSKDELLAMKHKFKSVSAAKKTLHVDFFVLTCLLWLNS